MTAVVMTSLPIDPDGEPYSPTLALIAVFVAASVAGIVFRSVTAMAFGAALAATLVIARRALKDPL